MMSDIVFDGGLWSAGLSDARELGEESRKGCGRFSG